MTMRGNELRDIRKNTLRLRQDQFGRIVGVHFTTISDWERENKIIPKCAALVATLMAEDIVLREKIIEQHS